MHSSITTIAIALTAGLLFATGAIHQFNGWADDNIGGWFVPVLLITVGLVMVVTMSDGFGERDARKMPRHLFSGALRLDYGTATRADISKQNFSVCPRYWYVDATFLCPRCGENFIFTRDEQRLWYEELGFWIDSCAKHCAACRGELRKLKSLRQEYDREIEQAVERDADPARKRRLLDVIQTLEDGGVKLPERMQEKRHLLRKQLERIGA